MTYYCTLNDARNEIKATTTTDDSLVMLLIRQVSTRIDRELASNRPYFAPFIEQRRFQLTPNRTDSWYGVFNLNTPLLDATAVSVNGVTVTNYEEYPAYPSPFYSLRLTDETQTWWTVCTGQSNRVPRFVIVDGIWGYNSDYARAWVSVDSITTVGGINTTVTTFTVNDVDGLAPDGLSPRLSAGNLIRIGSEFMNVLSTVTTSNTVTVQRAVNGSTASAHAQGDTIEVWQVDDSIRRITARQTALLYARRGAFDNINITDLAVQQYPSDLLSEVRGVLTTYVYD